MTERHRSVVIHGHFYQPPRDDPWLEETLRERGAAPFHDWNERVEHECYRAVVAARVQAGDGRIARIVNTLASVSFDFGPTLLRWMERQAPTTYAAVLDADRASGNAIAMPYHHVILPLASRRDKVTEVRWGIEDFRRRFGREPEGLWLPETAVDGETLEVLAAAGIRFTIVGSHQVGAVPAGGLPGRYTTSGGHELAVFAYDGALSHDVAFGELLRDAGAWGNRLLADRHRRLVAIASDGETYGHHHRFGEMALAALLKDLGDRSGVRVENFATFLARHPPREDIELVAPSSWSCPHGVERWRDDCGCKTEPTRGWRQEWRAALREALEGLAAGVHEVFDREGGSLFGDAWAARDDYGAALAGGDAAIVGFLRDRVQARDEAAMRRAAELIEMERHALGMFTSCGWFFDDIGGLESRQVLRYAARAVELAGAAGPALEAELRQRLAAARSNDPAVGTGREIYDAVRPSVPPAAQAAAAFAAGAALGLESTHVVPAAYRVEPAGDALAATHVRTGRRSDFRVSTERAGAAWLEVVVSDDAGEPAYRVPPTQLCETARAPAARALTAAAVRERLGPEEQAALGAGEALAAVAERALTRAVDALFAEPPGPVAAVLDLLDLFDLLELPYPFESQTAFYRAREATVPPRAAALADVARRLGFA